MTDKTVPTPACRIRAAGPSVRVGGRRFDAEPTDFSEGELSAEQYAVLAADTRLVRMPVLPEPEPEPKGKGKDKG